MRDFYLTMKEDPEDRGQAVPMRVLLVNEECDSEVRAGAGVDQKKTVDGEDGHIHGRDLRPESQGDREVHHRIKRGTGGEVLHLDLPRQLSRRNSEGFTCH
jgi:hypothetical protein